ncbi:hypothetical protein, partial [Stutzerimonas stutzeri]|uniref:hypothetical protein n=1 Tax=Stutzerimonas stutzeri TaxID=316 RepID=UPI001ED9262C
SLRVCLRLPAYSASAKVICFMEKLGWRDRRVSPDSGSLFQTFPNGTGSPRRRLDYTWIAEAIAKPPSA